MDGPGHGLAALPARPGPPAAGTLARDLTRVADPDSRWRVVVGRFLLGYPAAATRAAYARDLAGWAGFCAQLGVDPLAAGRGHVDAYSLSVQAGYAPATAARRVACLAALYRFLVDEDVLARTPVRGRRPRAHADPASTGATEREVARLLDIAAADAPRSYVLVALLYYGPLRISEAVTARAEDLGHERGMRTLTVTRKGGYRQKLPLPAELAHAVDELLAGRSSGPILLTRTGRPVDRKAAWKILRRLARAAGLPQAPTFHPHDLRHAAITNALSAGVPLRDVQDAAGHADPRTTRRYDRARERLDRHPGAVLAGRLAGLRSPDHPDQSALQPYR